MKNIKYILFLTTLLYSCTNSNLKNKISELEDKNTYALIKIDSLQKLDVIRFNNILLKETGTPKDTVLISEYEEFLINLHTEFYINLVKTRISIIKARPARQNAEKKLFGVWEWIQTDGGWGIISTPELEGVNRRISINEDYTIHNFVNGKISRRDSFYVSTLTGHPFSNRVYTIFNNVNLKSAEAFEIKGVGSDIELIFYTPPIWGMDFPSEKYRKISK